MSKSVVHIPARCQKLPSPNTVLSMPARFASSNYHVSDFIAQSWPDFTLILLHKKQFLLESERFLTHFHFNLWLISIFSNDKRREEERKWAKVRDRKAKEGVRSSNERLEIMSTALWWWLHQQGWFMGEKCSLCVFKSPGLSVECISLAEQTQNGVEGGAWPSQWGGGVGKEDGTAKV